MSSLVRCWFDNTKYEIQQDKKYLAHWLVAGIQQAAIIIKYKIQKYQNIEIPARCWSTKGGRHHQRAKQGRSRLLLSLHTNYNGTNGIWEKQNTNTKH